MLWESNALKKPDWPIVANTLPLTRIVFQIGDGMHNECVRRDLIYRIDLGSKEHIGSWANVSRWW